MRLIINLPPELSGMDPTLVLEVLQQHAPTIVDDLCSYHEDDVSADADEVADNCEVDG